MGAALRRPPTCPLHYKGWRNPIVVLLAACSIICADVWNSDDDDVIYICIIKGTKHPIYSSVRGNLYEINDLLSTKPGLVTDVADGWVAIIGPKLYALRTWHATHTPRIFLFLPFLFFSFFYFFYFFF